MYRFISERYYEWHKEYLRGLKLRYSVLEKEFPTIKDLDCYKVSRLRLARADKARVQSLFWEILLHETFFCSFSGGEYAPSGRVRELLGSETNLINQMYGMAMSTEGGFVGVLERAGRAQFFAIRDFSIGLVGRPILSLDISEHAYFGDYGFNKERYVRTALKYLNMSAFDSFF